MTSQLLELAPEADLGVPRQQRRDLERSFKPVSGMLGCWRHVLSALKAVDSYICAGHAAAQRPAQLLRTLSRTLGS